MTDVLQLLSRANALDIKLWDDGGRLRFSAPQGALTQELRDALVERKAELLEALRFSAVLPEVRPEPERRYEPFPLTDLQHAYWVGRAGALDLGGVSTHVYFELESRDLDVNALNVAWNRLVARHEMLRVVVLPAGEQQVLPEVPAYRIETLDLRELGVKEAEARLAALRERMSHEVLPAEKWPLFDLRATLLPDGRVRLHVGIDVLIADGASMTILFHEWAELYRDPSREPPPLTLSFRDYVLAEQRMRSTPHYASSRDYWLGRLDELPPGPDLPLAQSPAALARHRFQRRSLTMDHARWALLEQHARRLGISPSSALMTVFAEVLATWSKCRRFTINLTLFNRLPLHPEVDTIVGDFTSVTLLEVDCTEPASFAERTRQLYAQLLRDMDHRHFGGVEVIRELSRRRGRAPEARMPVVFTSGLALGPQGRGVSALRDLGSMVYAINQTPQVWLDLQVIEHSDGLTVNWDAVEELFPPGLLDDMFTAYGRRLELLAASDAAWSGPASISVPPDQLARRARINATEAPLSGGLLHTCFAEQAAARPSAPAILQDDTCLTYGELAALASGLSCRLRRHGARPGELVAVVMEKGWEQIVAVLAVLMSGAAYVPIDPDLPAERRYHLLSETETRFALVQPGVDERLTWPPGVERLAVTRDLLPIADDGPPPTAQSSAELAYVIYTSGSTGRPKGVMVSHRGAVNTILDINQRFGVDSRDRVLALSALSFDLSVYDIFGVLAAGGAVVLPGSGAARDPGTWVEAMRRHGVTLWNTVPTSMQMLVEHLADRHVEAPPSLRIALLSGDWVPVGLPARMRCIWNELRVISLGGATEASIWSIFHEVSAVAPCHDGAKSDSSARTGSSAPPALAAPAWTSVPYGMPLANQRFHVLDERMEPVPDWVPGQLYIGGAGVADGYWRDEARTRAGFVVRQATGERLYRTGDYGRYRPDGNIEFLGREDLQVKVRGHRIELGEIEAALATHPAVKEVVVAAVGEPRGERRLVGYVVMASSASAPPRTGAPVADPVVRESIERLSLKLAQPAILAIAPGTPVVELPGPAIDQALTDAYLARQSYREFASERIPLADLGFLSCLRQIRVPAAPLPKYLYPSAGSVYPVQVFVYVKPDRVAGLEGGFYYYHPVVHGLVWRGPADGVSADLYNEVNRDPFEASAFGLFLVADLQIMEKLYCTRARDYCLLEAGYLGQLLMTHAAASRIGLCPIGDLAFEGLRDRFALKPGQELLHSFLGGRTEAEQHRRWLQPKPVVPREAQLRGFLQEKLPDYMIPSIWVMLDALPRTSNDKIDRRALAALSVASLEADESFVAPRNELEAALAKLWQELLEVAAVSVHKSFFELGGDSLRATRLAARIRDTLGVAVPLADIFRSSTIAALAKHVALLRWAEGIEESGIPGEDVEEVSL